MYFSNTTGISTVGAQDKDVAVIAFTTAGVNMGNMLLLMRLNQNCNLEYTL
jgi:hypothetical protein